MEIPEIATICHEANRIYCSLLGDDSQLAWGSAPQWQVDSAVNGVQFHLDNPGAGPEASHVNWLQEKEEDGWVYGDLKDQEAKTHPCMVPYQELPYEQRLKDTLFIAIIDTFRDSYFISDIGE